MSFNREIINFTLSSNDIYNGVRGTFDNIYRSQFTFTNINLKNICGEMWNRYDYFNITLVGVISGATSAISFSPKDKNANIILTGLDFLANDNNDSDISLFRNYAYLGTISFLTLNTNNLLIPSYVRGFYTFRKSREIVNLTVSYLSTDNNTPLIATNYVNIDGTGSNVMPLQTLFLRIDPVDRDNMYQYPDKPDKLTGGQPRMKIF
jgi:hypothetical protein